MLKTAGKYTLVEAAFGGYDHDDFVPPPRWFDGTKKTSKAHFERLSEWNSGITKYKFNKTITRLIDEDYDGYTFGVIPDGYVLGAGVVTAFEIWQTNALTQNKVDLYDYLYWALDFYGIDFRVCVVEINASVGAVVSFLGLPTTLCGVAPIEELYDGD